MKKKAIAHNIIGSFSNFIFLFLTSIVLLPYYFKYISSSEYGIWLGGISFLSIISVLEANIGLILTQKLGEKWSNNEHREFAKYFTAALFVGLIISLIIIISTFLLKDLLYKWVSRNETENNAFTLSFLLYALTMSLTIVSSFINSVSQVFLKTFWPPLFNIFAALLGILISIWAVPKFGIVAIAIGSLFKVLIYTFTVSFFVYYLLIERKIKLIFNLSYVYEFLSDIRLPFISKVGMTVASNFHNFIIASAISASATTIFDITRKLPLITQMLINMLAVSTFTSFSLLYSERKDKNDKLSITNSYFTLIRIIMMISLLIVFLVGKDFVKYWVGIDKFGGDYLLALMCILACADLLRSILSQQYYAIGSFRLTSVTEIIFALAFILFAFILIPHFQLIGIVFSSMLANIAYFMICIMLEKRYNISMVFQIINYQLAKDFTVLVIIAILTKLLFNTINIHLVFQLFLSMVAVLMLLLYLYFANTNLIKFVKTHSIKFLK